MKGHKFLKITGILMIVSAAISILAGVFVGGGVGDDDVGVGDLALGLQLAEAGGEGAGEIVGIGGRYEAFEDDCGHAVRVPSLACSAP